MANLKDIVATLAILSAGTLTLTGCKKEGETTTPDDVEAGDSAGAAEEGGEVEASCKGEEAVEEASCSGEEAPADGEVEAPAGDEAEEASCSGAA
jgi:hypothetical protein